MSAFAKRAIDLVVAIVGLLVFAPVFLVIAAAIRVTSRGPVFFIQPRAGQGGHPFRLIKFRTMREAFKGGVPLPDEERLTSLGRFLRSTSLDEIPQLLNVLKGEMSLVGPRPLLLRYLDRYTREQSRRHEVKPGITGWAQISGRNALSWDEKFKLDVWYVDHQSVVLDVKILVLTVLKVLSRAQVSADGHATMPEFMGSHKRAA